MPKGNQGKSLLAVQTVLFKSDYGLTVRFSETTIRFDRESCSDCLDCNAESEGNGDPRKHICPHATQRSPVNLVDRIQKGRGRNIEDYECKHNGRDEPVRPLLSSTENASSPSEE